MLSNNVHILGIGLIPIQTTSCNSDPSPSYPRTCLIQITVLTMYWPASDSHKWTNKPPQCCPLIFPQLGRGPLAWWNNGNYAGPHYANTQVDGCVRLDSGYHMVMGTVAWSHGPHNHPPLPSTLRRGCVTTRILQWSVWGTRDQSVWIGLSDGKHFRVLLLGKMSEIKR